MREILFRGKRMEIGLFATQNAKEWVYGGYAKDCSGEHIYSTMHSHRMFKVIPSTIGQYTGLTDKNGVKIFEGDIAQYDDELAVVKWDDYDAMFYVLSLDGTNWITNFSEISGRYLEVIGNIHDNPELLLAPGGGNYE